jgi:hypothetical protein
MPKLFTEINVLTIAGRQLSSHVRLRTINLVICAAVVLRPLVYQLLTFEILIIVKAITSSIDFRIKLNPGLPRANPIILTVLLTLYNQEVFNLTKQLMQHELAATIVVNVI